MVAQPNNIEGAFIHVGRTAYMFPDHESSTLVTIYYVINNLYNARVSHSYSIADVVASFSAYSNTSLIIIQYECTKRAWNVSEFAY